ncbi:glycosyltransferase family 2 protein, partial [Candidatus Parabeggiatoa sp. HSG14]|uniref:glycosyltransferase family 2 protein n=1 Tax=Candidatus Parabeggiatoa sp. HSG14 TaxID=3055593 RepID=UPI0025A7ABEE|nr:glycosyltransferase family 2 protein [Thiotrichales bacterium HSG14]
DLPDNEYINIPFSTPQTCIKGQPVDIQIYSENADENNVVTLWCTKMPFPFVNTLDLKPLDLKPPLIEKKEQAGDIRVSIVIPVFNKALYTYNCLLTLLACDQEISKEVIIINNASTDETATLLDQLHGAFQIINNEKNQGFVLACRQGAEIATGEFILFLNNDTQVMPGWLVNMVKMMDTQLDVGITGSKLIYPDRHLQEAGGIIFNDASGWNYGRLQDPTDTRFNQSREVDYCSGASLMIRKTLWEEVGGFDMRFAPAYYEDTDLCFAVRQAGYKVFYCHDSEVIHHEGITAGTDVQSGYKAYQVINHKKFQAKWWDVLSTHPSPPPQTSPDAAAFRFMANKSDFRIPNHKILATHLLGQGWAANFWSYINLHKIDEELESIKSIGFNTVIILVPWVGFQTQVAPITYYEAYFTLFKQVLNKVQSHDLQVILRIGYTHDNGPYSEPDGFLRQIVMGADAVTFKAWCDYLDRLWAIAQHYPNILGGFITWEDFFLMDLVHVPPKQRLMFATRTGYQAYLQKHYSLEEISSRYKQSFSDYAEVPIPAFKSSAIHLFCEFWDKLLIETIFKESKKHFPALTMEVRLDGDPQEESLIHHHNTFDLTSETYLTTIYYTPAWGAPNDGGLESASSLLKRMQYLFEKIRSKTNNAFFIDQFNFIDNTPGFEHNTGILPEEMPDFLSGVADILQQQTIGYGMWTLHDVRANALKNGLFEMDYPCWEIEDGEIIVDSVSQKKAVLINQDGTLSQLLSHCAGVPLVEGMPFKLDFQAKKTKDVDEAVHLLVSVVYENNILYENTILEEQCENWQNIHLEEIPFYLGHELRIENRGVPLLLSDFYLYQQCQENGIIDAAGNPKSFYNDLVSLNQKLNQSREILPKSFFQQKDITPQMFNGIFPDLWMGKTLTGIIAKPTECETLFFVIKAYVPETWYNYQNQLTLILDDKQYLITQLIHTGCTDILIPLGDCSFSNQLFFQLEAKNIYSPKNYDELSQDNREVSMQLIELGFRE